MSLVNSIIRFFSAVIDNIRIMKTAQMNGYMVHSIIRDGDGLTLAYVSRLPEIEREKKSLLSSQSLTMRGTSLYGSWIAIN